VHYAKVQAWHETHRAIREAAVIPQGPNNLFAPLARDVCGEDVSELVRASHVRIERIVSVAHASPPGFWYDQDWAEWVVVLKGSAGVLFEGESASRILREGDYLSIPAHCRHRVDWTQADTPTVWLAVHWADG
jgi:cupin 2 domain-containing protein